MSKVHELAAQVRNGTLHFDRKHYALSLLHGILQAEYCGYKKISAIEFGVGDGGGYKSLVHAALHFSQECDIEIDVYGFDSCIGLPAPKGYRDHPEIWHQGEFAAGFNAEEFNNKYPSFAHMVIGDVNDTVPEFIKYFKETDSKIAFVSVDVDYYSSTVPALTILEMPPEFYVPAVPMYIDDVNFLLTYSQYAGEALAINEFNKRNSRKIESKEIFAIENFHVCHIFDHPVRTGKVKPLVPFEIYAKPKGVVHPNGPYFSI